MWLFLPMSEVSIKTRTDWNSWHRSPKGIFRKVLCFCWRWNSCMQGSVTPWQRGRGVIRWSGTTLQMKLISPPCTRVLMIHVTELSSRVMSYDCTWQNVDRMVAGELLNKKNIPSLSEKHYRDELNPDGCFQDFSSITHSDFLHRQMKTWHLGLEYDIRLIKSIFNTGICASRFNAVWTVVIFKRYFACAKQVLVGHILLIYWIY